MAGTKARVFKNPNTRKWVVLTPFKNQDGYYTTRFISHKNAIWFAQNMMQTRTDCKSNG